MRLRVRSVSGVDSASIVTLPVTEIKLDFDDRGYTRSERIELITALCALVIMMRESVERERPKDGETCPAG